MQKESTIIKCYRDEEERYPPFHMEANLIQYRGLTRERMDNMHKSMDPRTIYKYAHIIPKDAPKEASALLREYFLVTYQREEIEKEQTSNQDMIWFDKVDAYQKENLVLTNKTISHFTIANMTIKMPKGVD